MSNPFDLLFMRHALIAVLLIAPMYALLGTIVVSRGMAFFSESLGHGALCGVAIGTLLGLTNSTLALVLFGLLYATLLFLMQRRASMAFDALIGVLSSVAVALGVVLLSRGGGFAHYSSLLVGDLLSVAPRDLWLLGGALMLSLLYWFFAYNRLVLVSISAPLAHSRGVGDRAVQLSFMLLVALVVMLSIRYVGALIINALLILPASAARNVSRNMRQCQWLALALALVCSVGGLVLSYYMGTAAGATIVLLLGLCFFATFALRGRTLA